MNSMIFIVLLSIFNAVWGHSLGTGGCLNVEPMQDFNMKKFLGVWYDILKTGTESKCLLNVFRDSDEPNTYKLEEVKDLFFIPGKSEYHNTATLKVLDPIAPAKLEASFLLSTQTYVVLATDYDTYAAVYSCDKLPYGHRYSISIMSRSKTLDKLYVDKLINKLRNFNIDTTSLSPISQENCPKYDPKNPETVNIHINEESVKKTWDGAVKIGKDVVNVVKDAFKGKKDDSHEEASNNYEYDIRKQFPKNQVEVFN